MPQSLDYYKKSCRQARQLMERANQQGFAVGAFNIDNQETLVAVANAAKKLNAPVMVELSKGEADMIGLHNVRDMVDNYKLDLDIEMYINLDHSPSVEDAKAGIDAGFEFIHIDYSQAKKDATREEIIATTKEVVEYAKKTGAIVESEPHYFGGSSNLHDTEIDYEEIRKTFSTPAGSKEFIEATGIDTLAVAIGNLHGKYPVPKQLDLDLLAQIRQATDVNLSLHGGSGTPNHYYTEAAKIGISKVNINSDMRYAYRKTLEKVLAENPNEFAVIKLMPEVLVAVQNVVEEKINAFNATDKALV